MPAATTKLHKLNYKGSLHWLKRFLKMFYTETIRKKVFYVIHLSKETKDLHHRLFTTRKDLINLKWIPPPRILLKEFVKLEDNFHHGNI